MLKRAHAHAREEVFLTALLGGGSLDQAALAANISRTTGWRIRQSEQFEKKYRAAQATLFSGAVDALHSSALDFVMTLRAIATDGKANASARATASDRGLTALFKAREIFDLSARVAALESAAGEEQE